MKAKAAAKAGPKKESAKKPVIEESERELKAKKKLSDELNESEVEREHEPENHHSDSDDHEEHEDESSHSGGGNAAALAAAGGNGEMSASFKNFRHHPDMENFYRFIYENDLRHEALAIIDEMMTEKHQRKLGKGVKLPAH